MSRSEDRQPDAERLGAAVDPDLRVEHESLGRSFTAEEGRPILDSGLEQGLDMDYGCRVGACGACAVEVIRGLEHVEPPDFIEQDALTRYELPGTVRLACRACVRGPITLRSLEE